MFPRTLHDATLADLSATAVPPQCFPQIPSSSFPAKRMDPITGRALECLAHAIEYLEDTRPYDVASIPETVAADQAVRLLKGLNRQIFAELPNLPERRSLLRLIADRWERASQRELEGSASRQ